MMMLTIGLMANAADDIVPQKNIEGTLFLVNREHQIDKNYVPSTVKPQIKGNTQKMREDAAKALEEMFEAAKNEENILLTTTSGYRSFSKQKTIYQNKLDKVKSKEKANEYVALPGASEHQLGLAMDIGAKGVNVGLNPKFGQTEAGIWVAENAHRFGFIIRYQEGFEEITGYRYEPWHIRYVGKEHATAIKEMKVPMEIYMINYQKESLEKLLMWEEGEFD